MKHSANIALFLFIAGMMALSGCRSRKRSEKVGAAALKVVITLKNIDSKTADELAQFNYQIRCNGGEWVDGSLADGEAKETEYFVKGVKAGDTCAVRVMARAPSGEYLYTRAEGEMWGTDDTIPLATRIGGQLWAEAMLAQFYAVKTGVSLRLPVIFTDGLPARPERLMAQLHCNPDFNGLATGMQVVDRSKKEGVFVFSTGLSAGIKYQCSRLDVQENGQFGYFGDVGQTFSLESNQVAQAKPVTVKTIPVTTIDGFVIITEEGEACKPGEIFDLQTRTCRPGI